MIISFITIVAVIMIMALPSLIWIKVEKMKTKLRWRIITGLSAIIATSFFSIILHEVSMIGYYYNQGHRITEIEKTASILSTELGKNDHIKERKKIVIDGLIKLENNRKGKDLWKEVKRLRKLNTELHINFAELNSTK